MFLLASGEFADALALTKQFGPSLAMVIFFLYRDFRRENRLMERIDKLENEQREIVMPLVTKCTEVISKNTDVMDAVRHRLKG